MTKHLFYIVLLLATVLFDSCSSNGDDLISPNKDSGVTDNISVKQIQLTIADVGYEDADSGNINKTRSISYNTGQNAQPYWAYKDTIGIFPEGGYQIPFLVPLDTLQTSRSVIIQARGWAVKPGILYAVYQPFVYDYRDARRLPLNLQVIQHQESNKSFPERQAYLGKYWVMGGDTVTMKEGATVFNNTLTMMTNVMCIICNAPSSGNFTRMMIVAQKKSFPVKGYYDLFDIKAAKAENTTRPPVPYLHQPLHVTDSTDHVILDFDECQVNEGERIYAYYVLGETNLGGQDLSIYLWDDKGNIWTQSRSIPGAALNRRNYTLGLTYRNTWTKVPNIDGVVKLNDWEKEELCPDCTPVVW